MFDDQEEKSQCCLSAVSLVSDPSSTCIDKEENWIQRDRVHLTGIGLGRRRGNCVGIWKERPRGSLEIWSNHVHTVRVLLILKSFVLGMENTTAFFTSVYLQSTGKDTMTQQK